MKKDKLIIIGAGLSGLYSAYLLQDRFHITILEARDRIGGRILTIEDHDMGPSWVWSHQRNILDLTKELELELFVQHTQGLALYDTPKGIESFTAQAQPPSARIVGGLSKLVKALYQKLDLSSVKLNEAVTHLEDSGDGVIVKTQKSSYSASKVILTIPPRLAAESITYRPALTKDIQDKMLLTPTWMGHSAKCVIEYKEAFWRQEGLSGFVFSPLGPLSEVHDACTKNNAALFGFIHTQAPRDNIKDLIIKQLLRLFGEKALNYTNIHIIDWKNDPLTATKDDAKGLSSHPSYGMDISYFEEKLLFGGTELSFKEGGYLEGALNKAVQIVQKL